MFENPRRGRQARNFTTTVPKILDLKSQQIFSENCRWVPLPFYWSDDSDDDELKGDPECVYTSTTISETLKNLKRILIPALARMRWFSLLSLQGSSIYDFWVEVMCALWLISYHFTNCPWVIMNAYEEQRAVKAVGDYIFLYLMVCKGF